MKHFENSCAFFHRTPWETAVTGSIAETFILCECFAIMPYLVLRCIGRLTFDMLRILSYKRNGTFCMGRWYNIIFRACLDGDHLGKGSVCNIIKSHNTSSSNWHIFWWWRWWQCISKWSLGYKIPCWGCCWNVRLMGEREWVMEFTFESSNSAIFTLVPI